MTMTSETAILAQKIASAKEVFSRHLNQVISDDTLSKLLGGDKLSGNTLYQAGKGIYAAKIGPLAARFDKAYAAALRKHSIRAGTWLPGTTYDLPEWDTLQTSLRIACGNTKTGEIQRIVWLTLPPGGGKTVSIGRLLEAHNSATKEEWRIPAKSIVSQESWRKSFFSCLRGLAAQLGVEGTPRSEGDAEDKIFAFLNTHPRLICLDEVEFVGVRFTNLLRKLCETKAAFLICCLPQFFADFGKYGGEHTDQLMDRNVSLIPGGDVTPDLARRFLADRIGEHDELDVAASLLAAAANGSGCERRSQGGSYRLCNAVANQVAAVSGAERFSPLKATTEAIDQYRAKKGISHGC